MKVKLLLDNRVGVEVLFSRSIGALKSKARGILRDLINSIKEFDEDNKQLYNEIMKTAEDKSDEEVLELQKEYNSRIEEMKNREIEYEIKEKFTYTELDNNKNYSKTVTLNKTTGEQEAIDFELNNYYIMNLEKLDLVKN